MEEYINAEELSLRIKEKKQTIYNRIYKKEFILGIHYVKPTPKKLLFKWNAIISWLEGSSQAIETRQIPPAIDRPTPATTILRINNINI